VSYDLRRELTLSRGAATIPIALAIAPLNSQGRTAANVFHDEFSGPSSESRWAGAPPWI